MLGPEFIRLLGGAVPKRPHSDLGRYQGHSDIYNTQVVMEGGVGVGELKREPKKNTLCRLFIGF